MGKKGKLLGVGLDNKDGHRRITRSEEFIVTGGSKETHEQMQDQAIRFTEEVKRRGKHINELCRNEFAEILDKSCR